MPLFVDSQAFNGDLIGHQKKKSTLQLPHLLQVLVDSVFQIDVDLGAAAQRFALVVLTDGKAATGGRFPNVSADVEGGGETHSTSYSGPEQTTTLRIVLRV